MTLEDFFTSTELKDGLTTPTRVNELLTVMQNEKENIVNNFSDITHQWSTVATVIAATENKECLDLFIQLDGLWFIDKWLKDAQKLMIDSGNGGFEELIIALLRALERLQVDHHRSVGSGIGLTVQGLLGHSSLVVWEKAKDICDRWAVVQDVDGAPTDVSSVAISPGGNNNNNNVENVEQSVCSDTVQQETDKEEMPTQEAIMETETETIMVENNKSKSESTPLTGISSPLEDVKEKQENDCLTTLSSLTEHKTSTSDIDVDHGLDSATKTETMEDVIDKDEEMVDGGEPQSPDQGNTTTEFDTTSGIGDSASGSGGGGLEESPDADNPKTTSDTDSDEGDEDRKTTSDKDVGIESGDDSASRSRLGKHLIKSQDDDLIGKKSTDMELDYGMVDPLELARQVANEVEIEVDSQEQSCSSTTSEKEPHSTGGMEVSSGLGPGSVPTPADPDIPATQNNETGQGSGLNPEKGFSGFDLNQEFSSDEIETDGPVDQILTPVSVVSANRAAAADGIPVAPLQFEGTLGWKGSAATSAFRRIPESEKTYSSSSSHNNSNPRLNHLDFDLNVAESSDDKLQDFLSRDKVEESSKLQLDLNSLGDGDAGIISLDWKRDNRVMSQRQNGPHSQSSSSTQPSYKNVDLNLNDHLTIQNNASFNNPFLGKPFNKKRDESVISIFGTQVEVNRNEYIPHPTSQPTNGRILEPSVDFSLGQPGPGSGPGFGFGSSLPYANPPAYGYGPNGYTMGPMYGPPSGPIPYMVDSRGAPIVPPIQPTFSQPTQPFFFNLSGAPPGSNGAGPSRNSVDLNPGFITEMGSRENNNDNIGLRQFFNHNQASSSSVTGGKREEPDSGWELFPMNYKHQQPPWQ